MSNFSFWQKWLLVVGISISVFGVLMALFSGTPIFDLFNRQIDPAFWNGNVTNEAREFQKWMYGVWGATIAGWGVFVTFVAYYPFARRERWAWNCLVAGVLLWFVLDTVLSLNYRVIFNVGFNTVLLIAAGLPLLFTRNAFMR